MRNATSLTAVMVRRWLGPSNLIRSLFTRTPVGGEPVNFQHICKPEAPIFRVLSQPSSGPPDSLVQAWGGGAGIGQVGKNLPAFSVEAGGGHESSLWKKWRCFTQASLIFVRSMRSLP